MLRQSFDNSRKVTISLITSRLLIKHNYLKTFFSLDYFIFNCRVNKAGNIIIIRLSWLILTYIKQNWALDYLDDITGLLLEEGHELGLLYMLSVKS